MIFGEAFGYHSQSVSYFKPRIRVPSVIEWEEMRRIDTQSSLSVSADNSWGLISACWLVTFAGAPSPTPTSANIHDDGMRVGAYLLALSGHADLGRDVSLACDAHRAFHAFVFRSRVFSPLQHTYLRRVLRFGMAYCPPSSLRKFERRSQWCRTCQIDMELIFRASARTAGLRAWRFQKQEDNLSVELSPWHVMPDNLLLFKIKIELYGS